MRTGKDVSVALFLLCVVFFYSFTLSYFFCVALVWLLVSFNVLLCPLSFSRADLLGVYEQIILRDIDFSDSQNVDQSLWKNVFYQVIERFRQLLKDPTCDNTPHIRNLLLTLLDEVRKGRVTATCIAHPWAVFLLWNRSG